MSQVKATAKALGRVADGYVPAEGVGAVLLKPLAIAELDGDHIYAVIKATTINHGGKTNGYTVPNPHAQAEVIARALKETDIDARTISYIEAHGTGTVLGDPIEMAGLTRAFETCGVTEKQYCAIGSVKSNIGHAESAAGIAGVTKVLLQMRYGQLFPSLHAQVLNPHIDWSHTPFVVQEEVQATLAAKVIGVELLDEASSHIPLDFFILCSSLSAVMGGKEPGPLSPDNVCCRPRAPSHHNVN